MVFFICIFGKIILMGNLSFLIGPIASDIIITNVVKSNYNKKINFVLRVRNKDFEGFVNHKLNYIDNVNKIHITSNQYSQSFTASIGMDSEINSYAAILLPIGVYNCEINSIIIATDPGEDASIAYGIGYSLDNIYDNNICQIESLLQELTV